MARPLFSVFLCGGGKTRKKNGKKRSGHARRLFSRHLNSANASFSDFIFTNGQPEKLM